MTDQMVIFITMLAYMGFVVVIGLVYARKNQNAEAFYLGGRGLGPWVAAMSAEASDMSSWLLMGLPGVAFAAGLGEAAWVAIGLAVGTYLNWLFVAKRLRNYTQVADNAITLPDYLSNRFHDKKKILMSIAALFILIFFTLYVATGFNASGKLFNSVFGYDYTLMMGISAAVIVIYTVVGGFLAESTTDFIQGIVMFISLILIIIAGVNAVGGLSGVMAKTDLMPGYMNLFQKFDITTNTTGTLGIITIISSVAWGLGYFGMPHVLLRFMAIRSAKELKKSRRIAMIWVLISLAMAVFIGVVGYAVIGKDLIAANIADKERVLIRLAMDLLVPVVAGVVMSGILAAQMSTSDSQLLITSSAISTNIFKGIIKRNATDKQVMIVSRVTVVIVAIVGAIIALDPGKLIFDLVSNAWAGFGATFGPIILFSLFWKRTNLWGALAGMLSGGITVIIWIALKSPFGLYEIVPGFIVSAIFIVGVSLLTKKPSNEIVKEFETVKAMKD